MTARFRNQRARCEGGCERTPPWAHELRHAVDGDTGWVLRSWLESYHDHSIDVRGARFADYRPMMMARMTRLIAQSIVIVACDPDEPSHLYGFVVAERRGDIPTVHFAYVKRTRREHGLASALLRRAFAELGFAGDVPKEWHFTHPVHLYTAVAQRVGHDGRCNASAAWSEMPGAPASMKGTG